MLIHIPFLHLRHSSPYMKLGRVFTILSFLLALYCALDPFQHSPIRNFPDFETHRWRCHHGLRFLLTQTTTTSYKTPSLCL
ncbi:hypothetical protein AHAS_Ahas18G0063800 [Arachis hypogaea]